MACSLGPLYESLTIRPLVPVKTMALLGSNSLILPLGIYS
jgi:hypothetical protein